jgi:hypothetical protein
MKSQPFDQNDESLRQVLQEWRVETSLPPRFQEGVWRRIELNETRSSGWSSLLSRIVAGIARPSLAASYLVILLLAGVLAGYWQARVSNAHAEQLLSARYVQVVDPYQSLHQTSQ